MKLAERPVRSGSPIRRGFVAAPLMLCGCIASSEQPATVVISAPIETPAQAAPAPVPPRHHAAKIPRITVRSAGLALFPSGDTVQAYVSVSGPGGAPLPVGHPKVSFSFFDPSVGVWEPIPNCQGVQSCKIPFPWSSGRLRAVFTPADPAVPEVSGELGYSNGTWSP